jgi:hypothetical protein
MVVSAATGCGSRISVISLAAPMIFYGISLSTDSRISWLVVFQGNLRLDHDAEHEL